MSAPSHTTTTTTMPERWPYSERGWERRANEILDWAALQSGQLLDVGQVADYAGALTYATSRERDASYVHSTVRSEVSLYLYQPTAPADLRVVYTTRKAVVGIYQKLDTPVPPIIVSANHLTVTDGNHRLQGWVNRYGKHTPIPTLIAVPDAMGLLAMNEMDRKLLVGHLTKHHDLRELLMGIKQRRAGYTIYMGKTEDHFVEEVVQWHQNTAGTS